MRKEKNRSAIYIAVFIAGVMILSVLGFIINEQEGGNSYGKYSFLAKNGQWAVKINGADLSFNYLPQEVDSINVSKDIIQLIESTKMVYITYDQNETDVQQLATAQYSLDSAFQQINLFAINAFTEAGKNITQADCKNATAYVPVILMQMGNENSISLNNNCIILKGSPLMTADRIKYAVYGVIK